MKYQLVIFDMDGTILDTLEDLMDSTNYCLRKYGLPERSLDEIRRFVGNGIHNLVERAVGENASSEELVEELYQTFLPYYTDHCAIKTGPYPGMKETIRQLREQGLKTAVVTNKADAAARKLCEDYFPGLFDVIVGDREGQRRKPAPDSVNTVLKELGMSKEQAVYVGDSEVDFATAENAGLDVIMVGWGFRTEAYIKSVGAKFVVHSMAELEEKATE